MLETGWLDIDLLLSFMKHADCHDYVDYSTRVLERALRRVVQVGVLRMSPICHFGCGLYWITAILYPLLSPELTSCRDAQSEGMT
jgi:hypothetical protein